MVRASAILLNIVRIFCAFTNKNTLLVTIFFLWDEAEASAKRERPFGTPALMG
jgi:hypothetical protein